MLRSWTVRSVHSEDAEYPAPRGNACAAGISWTVREGVERKLDSSERTDFEVPPEM